jgi:hypothetical protein
LFVPLVYSEQEADLWQREHDQIQADHYADAQAVEIEAVEIQAAEIRAAEIRAAQKHDTDGFEGF